MRGLQDGDTRVTRNAVVNGHDQARDGRQRQNARRQGLGEAVSFQTPIGHDKIDLALEAP